MFRKDEFLHGRDTEFPDEYTKTVSDNLDLLLNVMNGISLVYGRPMICTSGWRPAQINAATAGAAPHSKHMLGLACDIKDDDGILMRWVISNLDLMQKLGVFFEDFRWTPGWVHFQLGPPDSGHRVFVPNSSRPQSPKRWDGEYDRSFDLAA